MASLCPPCHQARNDPHYRFPTHLVNPHTGKLMVFDAYGLAICPVCRAVWHRPPDNTIKFVDIAA